MAEKLIFTLIEIEKKRLASNKRGGSPSDEEEPGGGVVAVRGHQQLADRHPLAETHHNIGLLVVHEVCNHLQHITSILFSIR